MARITRLTRHFLFPFFSFFLLSTKAYQDNFQHQRFPFPPPQYFPQFYPNFNPQTFPNIYFPQQNPILPTPIQPTTIPPQQHNQIPNILNQFQLPRQVRVPGRIEIAISGNDAEIICEFPRFLIIVQSLYWHARYQDSDPYGTFYSAASQNFAPRVNVVPGDKYKTILQIRNFNEDDYGTYRCMSSAILPEDDPPPPPQQQHHFYHQQRGLNNPFSKRFKRSILYPIHNYFTTPQPQALPKVQVFAPFFKPNFGVFGVFQEIKFAPVNSRLTKIGGRNETE